MRKSITLLLMAAAIAVFTGCEDDSSGKKDSVLETGNSTIRGNITDTGDLPARAVSAKVAATIPVWLKGTTTETYTDQNGNFIFENIPAGDYTICFEIGGKTYEYPISVSEGATLTISNLGVSADGSVTVTLVRETKPNNNSENDTGETAENSADNQEDNQEDIDFENLEPSDYSYAVIYAYETDIATDTWPIVLLENTAPFEPTSIPGAVKYHWLLVLDGNTGIIETTTIPRVYVATTYTTIVVTLECENSNGYKSKSATWSLNKNNGSDVVL